MTGWLRQRAAEHDQLTIASIENENPVPASAAHTVGVTLARRTSDVLRTLGFADGITPRYGAKVILTPTDDHLTRFANGPIGGSSSACRPGT